jgi:NADH:ubiquinone oxidoreductase subunit
MSSSLKGFNSVLAPFSKLSRSLAERGLNGTLQQMYLIGDIRFGDLKGTDKWGNKYYEDITQPYGQHRWIEYADIHNPDAAMIQPEWHGWMHHMFDETPEEMDAVEKDIIATTEVTHAIYNTHVGRIDDKDIPILNQSTNRHRGYKVGSLTIGEEDEEDYYLQPGHPLSKEKKGAFLDGRKETTAWSPNE